MVPTEIREQGCEQPRNEFADGSAWMSTMVRQLKKPTVDIKKFSGSPLEYNRFMRQFKVMVIQISDNYDEKLNYLEQFTIGEANKIVTGFSYLDSAHGFESAMRELKERYGDPQLIAQAFISKALQWPDVKGDEAKSLDEFSIFLVECENAVRCNDAVRILEYPENLKLIAKLPLFLHNRWRTIAMQKRDTGQSVHFGDLVTFVKRESKKANDPVYGRDAMGSSRRKPMLFSQMKPRMSSNFA
ncbi:uncharacterized protein LOC141907087 [Tubulanus polymorphus]|uniref:uncharacterized protein LOC141907087 n=1 Tax=Tubulanus polymorphus TaxID=672921 RepID=UPI003DA31449